MDFGSILYTAHKNEKSSVKEVKCYKTKFDPPKKEVKPPKPNLSANIQKYLQKREDEEKRRAEDEKRKKEELLALRSQDKKAYKRVQTMLKRTKSANKSVMEDAIDDVNTVVTMAGPQQCDEDDYGYVSKEASDFYSKMMDKYANMPPEEPKFSLAKKAVPKDLNAAKDRVKAALQRAEEEEMMPHKRKRKSKSDSNGGENGYEDEDDRKRSREPSPVEEPKRKKPQKAAPPPIDFNSLLKLAEQKQFEPVKIEKKVEDDDRRPMTKKQRLEYERELESRRRKEEREAMRLAAVNSRTKSSDNNDKKAKPGGLGRIPKKSNASESRPKQETTSRNSIESDDDQVNNSKYSGDERYTSKNSADGERYRNSYESKKDDSILRSSLLKSEDRKPLKPSQPSISSNKVKSRTHNMSNDEESDVSDSGYRKKERSVYKDARDKNLERVKSQREYNQKSSSGSERGYSEKNNSKRHYDLNEYNDSQSSTDSRKLYSSKSQSRSEANHQKYKPQVKYKPDVDGSKYEKYKPEKIPSKIINSSARDRSYSPDGSSCNSERNSKSRRETELEDESKYRQSMKGSSSYKNSNRDKYKQSDEERSQSPDYSSQEKKRKNSYSEAESEHDSRNGPPRNKLSSNKVKKISSLFEGSDNEDSSYNRKRVLSENEERKTKPYNDSNRHNGSDIKKFKSVSEQERQRTSSSDSKFRIPKSSKSESEKRLPENAKSECEKRLPENGRYSLPEKSSSSIKPSSKDSYKSYQEKERASSASKQNGDRKLSLPNQSSKPRPSVKTESKENLKKQPRTAEEVLKKGADVWSKPCNQTPSAAAPARTTGGLSESQLQRLREMNKKPTPSKPPGSQMRPGSSENRSSLAGRQSEGRPAVKPGLSPQGKQSLLMKAAAERGANLKAQMASSRNSESKPSTTSNKPRDLPSKDSRPKGEIKPKQFPPSDLRPKQFPPSDLKPRQFPPKDVRPRQFPPPDVKRKAKARRIIEDDSEDEYDSDMDSFIDDGSDLRAEDISREIQQIFGYDKSRYAGLDDEDDECMESNFGQIDREELRSLQIGAKEDYEELMRDLARKKRAKQRKLMEKGRR